METQLGTRIRAYRKQAGLTQSALAGQVGISTAYMNLIENNKRNVAGRLLNELIAALGVSRQQLTRGVTTEMIERLQQTARRFAFDDSEAPAELDQIEHFTTRFPGWARLLDHQITTHEDLERLAERLSDRLSHDPVLSETIHIMLSNITAIRSTAELLTLRGGMEEETRGKFLRNIFVESKRLSTTAEKLLLHLDPKENPAAEPAEAASPETTPQPKPLSTPSAVLNDPALQSTEAVLTAERLLETRNQHQFNPFAIADAFELPIRPVFLVLAKRGGSDGLPAFGLLETDNAGGVLFRQEIGDFRLPSRSGACPRWPIYRALGQPDQPITMRMQLNSGQVISSFAIAKAKRRQFSQLAPVSRSTMLYHETGGEPSVACDGPLIEVGFHCSVCSRTDCSDRRETYALKAES